MSESQESGPKGHALPRRRRWPLVLLGLLVLALVVRVALPEIARRVLVSQASGFVTGEIALDDVDLALLAGGVDLEGLRLRGPAASETSEGPLILSLDRLAVRLSWWELPGKRIHLREVRLESPFVAVERDPAGAINWTSILAPGEPAEEEPPEEPAPEPEGEPWIVSIDRLALAGGQLSFLDESLVQPETLELSLDPLVVEQLEVGGGRGEPARVALTLALGEGVVELDAALSDLAGSPEIQAALEARGLPLEPVQGYLAGLGWSRLAGRLDAALRYRRSADSETADGRIDLSELRVGVEGQSEPALALAGLTLEIGELDLRERRVQVASLALREPVVPVDPARTPPLLLLASEEAGGAEASPEAAAAGDAAPEEGGSEGAPEQVAPQESEEPAAPEEGGEPPASEDASSEADDPTDAGAQEAPDEGGDAAVADPAQPGPAEATAGAPGPAEATAGATSPPRAPEPQGDGPEPVPPEEPAPPWRWEVAQLTLEGGRVRVLGEPEPAVIGVEAEARSLHPEQVSGPLSLTLSLPEEGRIGLEGRARLEPLAADLSLEWSQLVLPALLARVPAPQAEWVRSGRSDGALRLTLGDLEGEPHGDLRVEGSLSLAELSVRDEDVPDFALDLDRLEVEARELLVPALVGEAVADAPVRVDLARVALLAPRVEAVRSAEGFLLPGTATAEAGEEAAPEQADAGQPAASTAPAAATPAEATRAGPDAAGAAPAPRIRVESLELHDGLVELVDRTVKPYYRGSLSNVEVEARGLRWPERDAERFQLDARGPEGDPLQVSGRLEAGEGSFVIDGRRVDLPGFNPYVLPSGYSIPRGALSVRTEVDIDGDVIETRNELVLHQLDVGGDRGQSLFQETIGVPLSLALALLRDVDGDISLSVPVALDPSGTRIGIWKAVRQAFQKAIITAVTAPLRLLGAVVKGGDKVELGAPEPFPIAPGRAVLSSEEAQERLDSLAKLVASRPGLRARVEVVSTPADARWLREQRVLEDLREGGVLQGLAALGEGEEREEIQRVLSLPDEERAEASLSPEAASLLDELVAEVELPPDALETLAAERRARVLERLEQDYGIGAGRVEVATVSSEEGEAVPTLRFEIDAG